MTEEDLRIPNKGRKILDNMVKKGLMSEREAFDSKRSLL
jgi:polyhydroxyalkanoate synthesis regulator phasin